MLCILAFDWLCNSLVVLKKSFLSSDSLELLNYGTYFLFYLVLSVSFFFVDEIKIKGKKITWKGHPLIRGILLLGFICLSVFYLA